MNLNSLVVYVTSDFVYISQVKFVYEAFKKLQPGIPVLALHGGMSQMKRVAAYNQFLWKQNVVMFATDIASRGLGGWS